MNTISDRRTHNRYPAQHLRVMVKSLREQERGWEKGLVSSVDFNRYGIALETECSFAVGDILMLLIRTDDGTVAEVNALVCNRTQTEWGFRLGMRFQHEGADTEPGLEEAIVDIAEEVLMIERQAAGALH